MASEGAGSAEVGGSIDDVTVSREKDLSEPVLEFLKEDDIYMDLADHFSRQGRGRRPILPHISTLTNGLLIQLHLIKEQQHASYRELKTWLEVLFDDTSSVTESRIAHRISTLLQKCKQMSLSDFKALLLEPFNFHALSPPLADIGLNRLHLTGIREYSLDEGCVVTNEVIIHLEKFRHSESLTPVFVRKWINILCSCVSLTDSKIRTRVTKVIKTYKSLQNRKKCHELDEFLSQPFVLESEVIPQFPPTKSKSCDECKVLQKSIVTCKAHFEILQEEKKNVETVLKNECDKSVKDVIEIGKALCNTEEKYEMLAEKLEDVKTSKLYKKNHAYKKDIRELKKDNVQKEFELEKERGKNDELVQNLKECNAKVKHEKTMKSKYKTSLVEERSKNSELLQMLSFDSDKDCVELRKYGSSHRYSDGVRQTFYALQGEANVAAEKCSAVVETVAKHLFKTNIDKSDLPCSSTSLNFSNEAHVIAKYQAVDEIKKSDSFTYACDGTSRQKTNFLEQHIILSNGKQLSLGFSEIARDDSETLLEKCVSLFKDLCEVYCLDDDDVDGNELLKDIIRKMMCLLSDRASVNKAFNQKMSKYKAELLEGEDCSVYFTFCNAHFLLALSAAAEKALQFVEQKVVSGGGGKLGRDSSSKFATFSSATECASLRLIRLAAEVLGPRGDEKSGCRKEWLIYCSSKGIKSTFSSFRSNRFNNLFQNATVARRNGPR